MDKKKLILGLIALVFFISAMFIASVSESELKIVKCYDENHNEMIGQMCKEEFRTHHPLFIYFILFAGISGGCWLVRVIDG